MKFFKTFFQNYFGTMYLICFDFLHDYFEVYLITFLQNYSEKN